MASVVWVVSAALVVWIGTRGRCARSRRWCGLGTSVVLGNSGNGLQPTTCAKSLAWLLSWTNCSRSPNPFCAISIPPSAGAPCNFPTLPSALLACFLTCFPFPPDKLTHMPPTLHHSVGVNSQARIGPCLSLYQQESSSNDKSAPNLISVASTG